MNNIKTFENFNNQDIFTYIDNNDIKSVKNYIDSGNDLDISIQDFNNSTPLIYAAYRNKIEIVELLLNSGVDIDKQNNQGDTALIYAAKNNNRVIIELLLDYHADEFILNKNNESFYDLLNIENKKFFLKEYPNKVHNAISNWYKKPFTKFVKDFKLNSKK